MLECTVSGSPAPAAKWFKNGKEVTPGPSHQRQHNNLAFVAVTRSDEGSYTCAADTEQGTVMSANYTVKVLGKKKTNEDVGSVGTDLTVMLICWSILHRARVHHGGPDQPARLSRLLRSLHLHSERKPVTQRHLAVQRRPHHPVTSLSDLWILAGYYRGDTAGRGRVSVSAGQRDWLGTVVWNALDSVRYLSNILNLLFCFNTELSSVCL